MSTGFPSRIPHQWRLALTGVLALKSTFGVVLLLDFNISGNDAAKYGFYVRVHNTSITIAGNDSIFHRNWSNHKSRRVVTNHHHVPGPTAINHFQKSSIASPTMIRLSCTVVKEQKPGMSSKFLLWDDPLFGSCRPTGFLQKPHKQIEFRIILCSKWIGRLIHSYYQGGELFHKQVMPRLMGSIAMSPHWLACCRPTFMFHESSRSVEALNLYAIFSRTPSRRLTEKFIPENFSFFVRPANLAYMYPEAAWLRRKYHVNAHRGSSIKAPIIYSNIVKSPSESLRSSQEISTASAMCGYRRTALA
ncbi:hypothetical protein BD410DRAFT_828572 [Rickenella mellea]|uniref:Uncharacterized protein n=1 Tax=Rickenella mellea TaxID=50990 RepID=A0A4Y7Q5N0_9AGAM|nr:hypothetical protein BD410DRAFT_828572 [Rickenella mellea]